MSVGRLGFYYVNGMLANDPDASQNTKEIQEILHSTPGYRAGESFVTLYRNDATTMDRLVQDIALGGVGIGLIAYAFTQIGRKKHDKLTAVILAVGIAALALAILDYCKMQEDKNKIASKLARRVSKFLDDDESRVAHLILHSQGADVGYRAMQKLEKAGYADRVKVMTLGAMTTIPEGMCNRVINYKFTNDLISRVVAFPFEMISNSQDARKRTVADLESEGICTHGVGEYLKERSVRDALRSFINPAPICPQETTQLISA